MEQELLFLFGLAIFAFTAIGTIAYGYTKKQETQKENTHYTNWGNQ